MVMEFNEEAFFYGEHLLGFDWFKVLDMIKLLAKININYVHVPTLQEKLKCIRMWANWRVYSARPDVADETEVQKAEDYYNNAEVLWEKGERDKAVELFEKAGLYGHPFAYKKLGGLYEIGADGLTTDIQKALHYYKLGAEDGFGDCAFKLGLIYRDGLKGLEPNLNEAYKWIRKAALLETCNAGNALGECYENGWGCELNLRKALYWYDVSQTGIENGDRLRNILRQTGESLPLRLDGFDYNIVHYKQDPIWWEDYYHKNNMIDL
jgi:tetratricopeptide (TPR) repeat protein